MDRSMQLQHLAEAEQHILRGAQHISNQEVGIADLDLRGRGSALARSVLETFRLIQAQVRRPKTTPIHELERYMRCKDCSEVRGYPYKRSHLVALRRTRFRRTFRQID